MKTQVLIIGGGPAGSACAIHLKRLGISSVIVEKETFPRFHIGESLTGDSGDLLRELGLGDAMEKMNFPIKYGIRGHGPRGFSPFWVPIVTRDPVTHEQRESHSWQVRRAVFDEMLLNQAEEVGTTVLQGTVSNPVFDDDGRARGAQVTLPDGTDLTITCDVLVDASGQRTLLANLGVTGAKHRGHYSRQVAIFSHFTGAVRDEAYWGNILTFFKDKHHWCWFIPINESVTSIGFGIPGDYYQSKNESISAFLTRELREFNQNLAARVENVERVEEDRAISNYSYHVDDFTGKGWMCIGDAHRFVDPLFSFGVNIGLREGRESAQYIHDYLGNGGFSEERPFAAFEEWSTRGAERGQILLDSYWETTFFFGMLLRKHEADFMDLFAGRLWEDEDYEATVSMRNRLKQQNARAEAAGSPGD